MTGPIDPTLRKVHVSLNVSELDRSIAFYRVLLGADPAKVRKDYAKFDLAEPPHDGWMAGGVAEGEDACSSSSGRDEAPPAEPVREPRAHPNHPPPALRRSGVHVGIGVRAPRPQAAMLRVRDRS